MNGIVRVWTQPRIGGGVHYLAGEIYAANVSRLLDVRGGRAARDFLRGLPVSTLERVTRGSGAARHPVLVVRDAGELIVAALAAGVTVMDERGDA